MIKFLVQTVCLLLSLSLSAQTISYLPGPDQPIIKANHMQDEIPNFRPLFSSDSATIVLRSACRMLHPGNQEYYAFDYENNHKKDLVERYSKKPALQMQAPISSLLPENMHLAGGIDVDGRYYCILQQAQNNQFDLYVAELSAASLQWIAPPRLLTSFPNYQSRKIRQHLVFSQSPDRSKMIFATYLDGVTNEAPWAAIYVADQQFNRLWAGSFSFAEKSKFTKGLKGFYVSNSGEVFCTLWQFNPKKSTPLMGMYNGFYTLHKISTDKKMISARADLDSLSINHLSLSFTDSLVVAHGFLHSTYLRSNYGYATGTFTIRYRQSDLALLETDMARFTEEAENPINPSIAYDRGREIKEGASFNRRPAHYFSNGDCLLLAESQYTTTQGTYTPHVGTGSYTNLHYSNILISYITREGKLKFCKRVFKEQAVNPDSYFYGFSHCWKGDQLYLFFNDLANAPASRNIYTGKVLYYYKEGQLFMATVNREGMITKSKCQPLNAPDLAITPWLSYSLNKGELFFFGADKGQWQKRYMQTGILKTD